MSGLLDRSALARLEGTGAALGSFHPLQTVVDAASAADRLRGAYAGIEGDERATTAGLALARALGMLPVLLARGSKPLYHAGAVFAANYTTVLAGLAERLATLAGISKETAEHMYAPLFVGAARNLAELGPVAALTGPIRRGDTATVKAHLAAIPPEIKALYQALGRAAVELAEEAGLPEPAERNLRSLLGEGSMEHGRKNISSGSPWEATVGYSRAVRVGPFVFVAGTTGTDERGRAVSADVYAQARHALAKIGAALTEAGARLDQVVRTRMFVTDIGRWEEIGRAHGEVFGEVRPAATMVEVRRLIAPDIRVEIEADAYVE
jgi:enamine deaminase RidA (YjgF/YER057c/UK114 family)